jgi:hypothetical protein
LSVSFLIFIFFLQVIGVAQMGVLNGVDSPLQLSAMVARLARIGAMASARR